MNIFVAKLSATTTNETLKSLFSNFGEVTSAKIIIDKNTGFSKRYGFVEMPNNEEAREAILKLNEYEFDNSVIIVKESLPKEDHQKNPNQRNKKF